LLAGVGARGRQAGPNKSGSNLPHTEALAPDDCSKVYMLDVSIMARE